MKLTYKYSKGTILNWRKLQQQLATVILLPTFLFLYSPMIAAGDATDLIIVNLQKTAIQGNAEAQCRLADYYMEGTGVEKDEELALKWYMKSADQGNAHAQNHLGYCYKNGIGIDKDEKEAVEWYQKAANQGLPAAQYNLAICYEDGKGVTENIEEAKRWFQKAADQGDSDAQQALTNISAVTETGSDNASPTVGKTGVAIKEFYNRNEPAIVGGAISIGVALFNHWLNQDANPPPQPQSSP